LACELEGPAGAPVVLVQGGISAGRHVCASAGDATPGWWDDFVGPGKAIDTKRYRALGIDYLGGQGASTGPANWHGEPPFPAITSVDQARATALLLEHLQIDRLHAWIGSSYGGMVGLALAADFPQKLERLVCISAAHHSDPMAMAWRSLQRRIVRLGLTHDLNGEALSIARALAMTTYRSRDEFQQRFSLEPAWQDGYARFPVEDYLAARGGDFTRKFTPEVFLLLSQAIDLHRVDPTRVHVPTLVVSVPTDQLVPPQQAQDLVAALGRYGRLVSLPSLYGHDAFLKEVANLGPILQQCLAAPVSQQP